MVYCLLTSWRKTNPEIPATNSARKTSDRNMAYCRKRKNRQSFAQFASNPSITRMHIHTHTHLTAINWTKCPPACIGFLIPHYRSQPLFPLSFDSWLINQHPPTHPSTASHQLQHPRASSAGGKASKQAKNDDDGPGANEDIRGVGGVIGYQRDVRTQHQLPPYSHCQQDGSCYL